MPRYLGAKVLSYLVSRVHGLQQADLDLSLVQEWLLVLDDLDGDVAVFVRVEGLDDLSEGALADQGVDLVPLKELLAVLDDVVVVLVVEAVVVNFLLFLRPPVKTNCKQTKS